MDCKGGHSGSTVRVRAPLDMYNTGEGSIDVGRMHTPSVTPLRACPADLSSRTPHLAWPW